MQVDAQQAELLSGSTVRITSDNLVQWLVGTLVVFEWMYFIMK